ncbi:MAG: ECF transporter S component [Clostridiales bacterium]|nr:ECF transporter S component [Clostridiales bacterium]
MKKITNVRTLTFIAMMGAVSTVLMMLNFSIPFVPGFLKFDISELPALFAGFFLGPVSGCLVILVKVALKLLFQGTETAFVGEFMNILGSVCFILPASLIYRWNHTKKGAVISLVVSSLLVSAAFIFINAYIAFPLYSNLYGMPMETIVAMGTAVNPYITDVTTLMLFSVFPFNLFKHGVTSIVTYLVYKRMGNVLRSILAPRAGAQAQSI